MRDIALMVRSDDGLLRANSNSKTPVSAVLLDADSGLASWPVATRSEETLGIP